LGADQPQPVDRAVLHESDRQCGVVGQFRNRERRHDPGQWVAAQQPQHHHIRTRARYYADVAGAEGVHQPFPDAGVVVGDLPGHHPHGQHVGDPVGADLLQDRHDQVPVEGDDQFGGGHGRYPPPGIHQPPPP